MTALLTLFIRCYQRVLSPILHKLGGPRSGCRFEPSCSEYCAQALAIHGLRRGILLGARRIGRCHPWSEPGPDPVPAVESGSTPTNSSLYGQKR